MGYLIDRAKERIGRVKADRATEQGIAGHQAASKALGNAAGWDRMSLFGTEMAISKKPGLSFKPGEGNLDVKHEDGPEERSAVRHLIDSRKIKAAKIEPNVIARHKPSEDF